MFSPSVLIITELLITITGLTSWREVQASSKLDLSSSANVFDLRYPIIISRQNAPSNDSERFFGLSVALSEGSPDVNEASQNAGWIFIGDPLDNSVGSKSDKAGAIWRCSLGRTKTSKTTNVKTNDDFCEKINIDPKPNKSPRDTNSPAKEDEGGSWIGEDIQLKHGRLVTCAPRWTRGGLFSMNGMCYFFPESITGPQSKRSYHSIPMEPTKTATNNQDYSHRLLPFMALNPNGTSIEPKLLAQFNFTVKDKRDVGYDWGLGQVGMSIEILQNGSELLLGAPGVLVWSGAVVRYSDNPTKSKALNLRLNRFENDPSFAEMVVAYRGSYSYEDPNNHWHDYFGYEVSSGRYFNPQETLYSSGAPRAADLTGEVVIFSIPVDPTGSVKRNITVLKEIRPPPQAFGSYFGSVLLSVDLNGDGQDELLVGAPLFTTMRRAKRNAKLSNKDPNEIDFAMKKDTSQDQTEWTGDHGSVFVYWFDNSSSIIQQQNLTGGESPIPGGRFGSAISFVRLNNLQNSKMELYIVIGAPYEREEHGAIYFFKMNSSINQLQFSHKITPEDVTSSADGVIHRGFGYTISLPVDIDNNDTPDLAIGAFKSNTVVILRSRPRIELHGKLDKLDVKPLEDSQAEYSFQICTSYELTSGGLRKNQETLEIWTEITIDRRLNMKRTNGISLGVAKDSVRFSNDTYRLLYKITRNNVCEKITTTLNETYLSAWLSSDDGMPPPVIITQTVWYNHTEDSNSTIKSTAYEIIQDGKTPVKTSTSFDVNSFEGDKPFAVPKKQISHSFNLSLPYCLNNRCLPELHLSYQWYSINDKNFSAPLTNYTIGSFDVVLRLSINNSRDIAQQPPYEFRWLKRHNIHLADDKINNVWSRRECNQTESEAETKYFCVLQKKVTSTVPFVRDFKFDMSRLYARKESDTFEVDFRFLNGTSERLKTAVLMLNVLNETSVRIIGSKMSDTLKNPFLHDCMRLHFPKGSENSAEKSKTDSNKMELYSKFRQTYRITLTGTRVEAVKITIKLPWGYKDINGGKSLLILTQNLPQKKNLKCEPVHDDGHLYDVQVPGDNSQNTPYELPPPVARRRKREVDMGQHNVVDNKTSTEFNSTTADDYYQVQDTTLHVNCLGKSSEVEWECQTLECTVTDISSYVEIHFDMSFVQKSIDELLNEYGKTEVLVESSGSAQILFEDKEQQPSHSDIAQTRLEKVTAVVEDWVYIVAVLSGILLLLLLIFALYKCGFFKREQKHLLLERKKEHARKSSMYPATVRSGSYMEMLDTPDEDPQPLMQTKKNSLGEVVEHM